MASMTSLENELSISKIDREEEEEITLIYSE